VVLHILLGEMVPKNTRRLATAGRLFSEPVAVASLDMGRSKHPIATSVARAENPASAPGSRGGACGRGAQWKA
ncbi:hypothetical protein P1N98_09085, partial [Tsukamurella tyrosinosolvens]|uniref:hypothetical protein n=1 Tax=Tsukamurella tyrosinosolvens TaxID=57704 RepID=UPI0024804CD1